MQSWKELWSGSITNSIHSSKLLNSWTVTRSQLSCFSKPLLGLCDVHVHVAITRTPGPWCFHISVLNMIKTLHSPFSSDLWVVVFFDSLHPLPLLRRCVSLVVLAHLDPSPPHRYLYVTLNLSSTCCIIFFLLSSPLPFWSVCQPSHTKVNTCYSIVLDHPKLFCCLTTKLKSIWGSNDFI